MPDQWVNMPGTYRLKFNGGSLDGQTWRTDSASADDRKMIETYFIATNGFVVGGQFSHATEQYLNQQRQGLALARQFDPRPNVYRVSEKNEIDGVIEVTLEFAGYGQV
jgi:hypothetical protein